jgi:hypothetical protein
MLHLVRCIWYGVSGALNLVTLHLPPLPITFNSPFSSRASRQQRAAGILTQPWLIAVKEHRLS